MSDKRVVALLIPSTGGRGTLILECSGYALRLPDLAAWQPMSRLLVRLDRNTPLEAAVKGRSSDLVEFRPSDPEAFAAQLVEGQRLVVRAEPSMREAVFEWHRDSKATFSLAAEIAGGDRYTAGIGFDTLTQGISRAAAGQYRDLAELLNAMGLKWRVGGQPQETGGLIAPIMNALRKNSNRKEVEDAGNVMFGAAWTSIRPMAQSTGAPAYSDISGPFVTQVSWLRRNCPST